MLILYFAGVVISLVFRVLPIRLGYLLADIVAILMFYLWPRGRTCLRENLAHVLGSDSTVAERSAVARRVLRNYARYLLEYCCLPTVEAEEIRRRVSFDGWENLGKAVEDGKGAILVGLHQGYWEITGAAVVLGGYPLNVVVERLPSRRLDRFVQERRRNKWLNVIDMEGGVGEMVEALRRNEHLVLLIDIPMDRGVEVTFCDAPIRMPRGAATLSLKTGAKVVPIASVRRPDNTFLTYAGDCISFQPSGSVGRDVQALTQQIMNSLEEYIKRHPEQYYMFRCMWAREAPGVDQQ